MRASGAVVVLLAAALALAPTGRDAAAGTLERGTGAGLPGFATGAAVGPLPSSLSYAAHGAFSWADWLGAGVDPLGTYTPDGGALVALSGPDLSLFPHGLSVSFRPLDPFSSDLRTGTTLPFADYPDDRYRTSSSRLSMRGGDDLDAWSGLFGRSIGDSLEAIELGGGSARADAPGGAGRADLQQLAGRVLVGGPDRTLTARGLRLDLDRRSPPEGLEPSVVRERRTASAAEVVLEGPRVRWSLLSATHWRQDRRDGGAQDLRTDLSGVSVGLRPGGWPVDEIVVSAGHVSADGSLLSAGEASWSGSVVAGRGFELASGRLDVAAGASQRLGRTVPSGRAVWSLRRDDRLVEASAVLVGRHPSALERKLDPRAIPTGDGNRTVGGTTGLEPERAAAVFISVEDASVLSGAGFSLGGARLIDPIVLLHDTGRPGNAEDETTGAAALWFELGRRGGAGLRLDASTLAASSESALRTGFPAPTFTGSIEAWFHAAFFRGGYLSTRWSATVRHESGRALGAWDGVVEDASTALDLRIEGAADAAVLFVAVRDVFETAEARLPLIDPGGRRFEAGFTWSFRG